MRMFCEATEDGGAGETTSKNCNSNGIFGKAYNDLSDRVLVLLERQEDRKCVEKVRGLGYYLGITPAIF